MIRFAVRTLLTALVLTYVLPAAGGTFTGSFFPDGIVYGLLLAAVAVGLTLAASAFALGTLGVGLIVLVPLMIFGFWFIPAIELKLLAHFVPAHLSLGWGTAILTGLVLLIVNSVTASRSSSSSS